MIISIGSINLDLQVRAERFPAESETVLAHDYLRAGGGKGANVALVAARLGVRALLMGRVGDDPFADLALTALRATDVDLSGVERLPGEATGTSMIVVREDGDKTIVLAANANQRWEYRAEEGVARRIRESGARVVVVDLEVPANIVRTALESARAFDMVAVLDPSPADRMQPEFYPLCDVITPNPREAKHLTQLHVSGTDNAARAGKKLIARGAGCACIKLRDGGAVLVREREVEVVRAPKVNVVDKTGAGDAFAGGLAVALARGASSREALMLAVMTSSFAVTRYGSQAAYPTRAELEHFVAEKRA